MSKKFSEINEIYLPNLTEYNKKIKKLPVLPSGLRFPVNANIDVNRKYLPIANAGNFVQELEESKEFEVTAFGPAEPTQDSPQGARTVFTIGSVNLFAKAVHTAYYEHYPLRLTADALWFTILQGLAIHLELNPDIAKTCFPDRQPKPVLTIQKLKPSYRHKTDDSTIVSLKQHYKKYLKIIYSETSISLGDTLADLTSVSYSTSTSRSKIAFKIGAIQPLRHLFKYTPAKGCGIPFIELAGKQDDWFKLRKNAKQLFSTSNLDLGWWKEALMPVLEQLCLAAQGHPNLPFFASICNIFSSTGENQPITGWLQSFFPYLIKSPHEQIPFKNQHLNAWQNSYNKAISSNKFGKLLFGVIENDDFINKCPKGIKLENIPNSLSKVKFNLVSENEFQDKFKNWYVKEIREKNIFCSGITAIIQHHRTRTLEPIFGWGTLRPREI